MGFLRAVIGVVIETAKLPVAIAKDVVTLGNYGKGSHTAEKLEDIKDEAEK